MLQMKSDSPNIQHIRLEMNSRCSRRTLTQSSNGRGLRPCPRVCEQGCAQMEKSGIASKGVPATDCGPCWYVNKLQYECVKRGARMTFASEHSVQMEGE